MRAEGQNLGISIEQIVRRLGVVAGLRRKAEQMGLDPNVWRGNVEVVAAQEIGRETVTYVANILKYYAAYRLIEQRSAERSRSKSRT